MKIVDRRSAFLLCALALVATFSPPVGSQPPAQAPPEPKSPPEARDGGASAPTRFQATVEVNIVNLTVRVTDQDGKAIKGLGRDQFEIREDGKPVELANFYEVSASTNYAAVNADRAARARSQAPAPSAAESSPAATGAATGAPPARHLAIFVDNANLHPRNRQLVFRGLRDFLHDRTGPGDRMMVVAYRSDYQVVQPFTESNADVVHAIDGLEKAASDGPETLAERRLVIRDLQAANLTPFGNTQAFGNSQARMEVESESRQILQRIETHARETRQRTLNTIGVLRYLVGSMAGLPEPKAILYLSDGLEMVPAQTLFEAHYNRFSEVAEALQFNDTLDSPESLAQEYDLTKEFDALAADAQTAGVIFYAIDASGQTQTLGGSAEFSMRDIGSASASNFAPVWTPDLDMLGEQNRQSTLRLLAQETGGAVLANTRNYDSFFADLRDSLDNYYSLGFQAPHDREGKRHQLEVRVKQPGAHVAYQRAYLDKPWEARLSEQTVSALILKDPIGSMTVQAVAGKPTPKDKKFIVPIQILVPVGALGLVPDGNDHIANLSLTVVTKDAQGNTKPAQMMELRLRLTAQQLETAANGEANIRLLLDAAPQEVGIGVRDRTTGATATTVISIDPRS